VNFHFAPARDNEMAQKGRDLMTSLRNGLVTAIPRNSAKKKRFSLNDDVDM
jgi:hypothetical protein